MMMNEFPTLRRTLAAPAAVVLLALVTTPTCPAEEHFEPYSVYVDIEGASTRCGPGGEYYRTDPLRHGQRLEVYLETAEGWLGVRPPEGSFCWIPADSVQVNRGETLGHVREDAAPAWIGTQLGKARKYMWQIQLDRGEEVVILGRAEREGPDGPQLWFRIAPPSGEFRWVHRDQVVDNPELLVRGRPSTDNRVAQGQPTYVDDYSDPQEARRNRQAARSDGRTDDQGGRPAARADGIARSILKPREEAESGAVMLHPLEEDQAVPLPPSNRNGGFDVADLSPASAGSTAGDLPNQAAGDRSADDIPVGSGLLAQSPALPPVVIAEPVVRAAGESPVLTPSATATRQASAEEAWVQGSGRGSRRAADAPAAHAGQSLDELQLELSRRMVASAAASEVESIRVQAAHLAAAHASEAERRRAQFIVERVEQYQTVARRRDGEPASGGLPPTAAAVNATAAPAALAAGPTAPDSAFPSSGVGTADSRTAQALPSDLAAARLGQPEASGYLVQVYSARPDSPPFALTDASGRTTHYVSPSPGLNLRRFLNQHITVAGRSGYETGLDTPHLVASDAIRSPEMR